MKGDNELRASARTTLSEATRYWEASKEMQIWLRTPALDPTGGKRRKLAAIIIGFEEQKQNSKR